MIHLDTNYLIGLLVKNSPEAGNVDGWMAAGQTLATSAIAWTEFLNRPVTPLGVSRAEAVLQSRIIPFGQKEAALAADLFNKTGRRRGSRFDCLIAAIAYYFDHREEIDQELSAEYRDVEEWKRTHPTSPFLAQLKEQNTR
jgi:predicted nucleic acid-binding protein